MSRVTAVISAYKCDKWLEGRITNLLEQDEHPKIIAVAQEESREQPILEKYPDVLKIYTLETPTVYRAWNIGIKAARTEYITNANADDRLYAGSLKKMADILDKEKTYGMVYTDIDVVTEIDGPVRTAFKWMEGGLAELIKGCFLGPMPMWRRKLHDRFGYFDEAYKSAGDYDYWMRLAHGGVKFYHVRDWKAGAYLSHQASVEKREPLLSLWEANNIRMKYREAANAQIRG